MFAAVTAVYCRQSGVERASFVLVSQIAPPPAEWTLDKQKQSVSKQKLLLLNKT